MNAYEQAALDMCLSSYPVNWTFEQVCEQIHETQDVIVWGPLAHLTQNEIKSIIDNHKIYFERRFNIKPHVIDAKEFARQELQKFLDKNSFKSADIYKQ